MRPRVRITPADVGRRVTIRTRLHDAGRHRFTDTVGELVSWQKGVVEVRRGDGSVTRLQAADIVAARPVPTIG